jgi:hypothetical protein
MVRDIVLYLSVSFPESREWEKRRQATLAQLTAAERPEERHVVVQEQRRFFTPKLACHAAAGEELVHLFRDVLLQKAHEVAPSRVEFGLERVQSHGF